MNIVNNNARSLVFVYQSRNHLEGGRGSQDCIVLELKRCYQVNKEWYNEAKMVWFQYIADRFSN